MTENPHRTKRTRSTLAVILPLLAIGVVAWVMLALMACGASSEPTGGEAERSEAADAETPQTSEIPEAAEAWLPVAGALLSEDEQTGEMVKVADVAIERDERGLVACVTETSYEGGAESTSTQTRYAYDEAGRVVSREAAFENALSPDSASTFTTDYVYDQDRLAMITTPETESTGRELFDYDERDHLITIMQTYDVDEASYTYFSRIDYSADDRPVLVMSGEDGSTRSAAWSYEADGRLVSFSVLPMGEDATNLMDYTLAYDEDGHVASVACAPGDYASEQHAADAQKTGYDAEITYSYDERGRVVEARAEGAYTYGDTFVTSATASYDERGNLASVDIEDANIFDGQESRRHSLLELQYERVSLPEGAAEPASTALFLVPSYDKQLFALFVAEPSLPTTPEFAPDFARATYLGYQQVLATY